MALAKSRTEHNGAKNGGGHWGRRDEAKAASRRHRREAGKAEAAWTAEDHAASAPEPQDSAHDWWDPTAVLVKRSADRISA